MKRLIISILLTVVVFGATSCSQTDDSGTTIKSSGNKSYKIVVIDGCQYITSENSIPMGNNYSFSITHKGNCTNHIHYR